MTIIPDSLIRSRSRSGIRISGRISSPGPDAVAAPNVASPEIQRCRSVSVSKFQASSSSLDDPQHRPSDVVSDRSEAKVESKNVALSNVTCTEIDSKREDRDEIRASSDELGESNSDIKDGEIKTIKEYIDLEFQNMSTKSKDLRENPGKLFGAGSVFRKFRNWRYDNKVKNPKKGNQKLFLDGRKTGEYRNSEVVGRKSRDSEPRFSVDACPIPFEEQWHNSSFHSKAHSNVSEAVNGTMGSMNKFESHRLSAHSIVEDESSSGDSGSFHSNSDSSSFMRLSSVARSSSGCSFEKTAVDYRVPPTNVKMGITEELKTLNLGSYRDDVSEKLGPVSRYTSATETAGSLNGPVKKSGGWRRVCNVFSFRTESSERICETLGGNVIDDRCEKNGKEGVRNSCDVGGSNFRRSVNNAGRFAFKGNVDFKVERNRSTKYSEEVTPFLLDAVGEFEAL